MKKIVAILILILFYACNKSEQTLPKNSTNISTIQSLLKEASNSDLIEQTRIEKVNEAIELSKLGKIDSLIYQSYHTKIKIYDELNKDQQFLKSNTELINWAKANPDKKYLANLYFNLGNYYYERYNTDSAYYYFNHSKNEFLNLNDKEGIAKNCINIAMILNDVSSYFESEKSSLDALNQIKDNPNHPYLAPIYNNLAVSSGGLLNYDEELYWYNKALALTEDPYYIASIKHNQAVSLSLLKRYDEAIAILEKIIDTDIVKAEKSLQARIVDNLAYAKWKKNKNYNPLDDYQKAINIYLSEKDYFGLSTTYDHLIEYYKQTQPQKALDYALSKYKITNDSNNTEGKLNALKSIITLQPNTEKIEEYISLTDSLQFKNSNSKYQFAKLEYDADSNREKIISLSLENTQNALKLEKAKLSSIVAISILVIDLIVFIAYLYFLKQKRLQERLSTIYETEVSLSQKLHDELANDLFSTITLVDSIRFEKQEIKTKLIDNLEHIYAQTRSISRQNNTIDTTNFVNELDLMLASYRSLDVNVITKGITEISWDKIDQQIKIVVYRVLMELMTNMKKHSNCNLVVIKLETKNKTLQVNYIDNGTSISEECTIKKNGLKNVENRISTVNGTIEFDRSKGFKVFISIPLSKF